MIFLHCVIFCYGMVHEYVNPNIANRILATSSSNMINAHLYHGLASLHRRAFPSILLKQNLKFRSVHRHFAVLIPPQ